MSFLVPYQTSKTIFAAKAGGLFLRMEKLNSPLGESDGGMECSRGADSLLHPCAGDC